MKDNLKKLIEEKEARLAAMREQVKTSQDAEELRGLAEDIDAVINELNLLKELYAEPERPDEEEPAEDDREEETDSNDDTNDNNDNEEERSMKVLDTMTMKTENREANTDRFDSKEYREAFMAFCTSGTPIPANFRTDAVTTTSDASAVIPTTILNEIVENVKVYGNLFDEVRKLNIQGGVEIPILSLKPAATWITANTGTKESDLQKLQANTKISFSYYGLECKVAQTLLTSVVSLEMFEDLFARVAAEAMAKALDVAIMNGTGSGQPTGVTADARVPAGNKITMQAADIASWSAWKKKVFAKMGKAYRDGKFYMAQSTFDGYIDGMVDDNGQPIGRVNYGIDGDERYRFGGKIVDTVEDDVIKAYDDAESGDVIAVFLRPSDYVFNSNMEMQAKRWVDEDTNTIKYKTILIGDGKLADPYGVLIIKKG